MRAPSAISRGCTKRTVNCVITAQSAAKNSVVPSPMRHSPRLALAGDQIEQVAHYQIGVDQVQTPFRQNLAARHDIARGRLSDKRRTRLTYRLLGKSHDLAALSRSINTVIGIARRI
jgi:hypothetical protein